MGDRIGLVKGRQTVAPSPSIPPHRCREKISQPEPPRQSLMKLTSENRILQGKHAERPCKFGDDCDYPHCKFDHPSGMNRVGLPEHLRSKEKNSGIEPRLPMLNDGLRAPGGDWWCDWEVEVWVTEEGGKNGKWVPGAVEYGNGDGTYKCYIPSLE